MSLPDNLVTPCQTTYRSVGLGVYAVVVRYCTMPLEKVAMIANSSLVSSGSNQLGQAWKIATKEGLLAPYRTVGPASITAWFLQYSVMGFVFQTVDAALSASLNTQRMPYGDQLMEPPVKTSSFGVATAAKAILAPVTAGTIESVVSNRAETQRFWGLGKSAAIERQLGWSALGRACGPAFVANSARNAVMSTTSFVATPLLFLHAFPQEHKSHSSLFWFGADAASLSSARRRGGCRPLCAIAATASHAGLSVNIFAGNVVAITQQSLWGRVLNYVEEGGGRNANYRAIVGEAYRREGLSAFFTPPKWFARVLMNAPIQGTLPWFYNDVLPLGEPAVLELAGRAYSSVSS